MDDDIDIYEDLETLDENIPTKEKNNELENRIEELTTELENLRKYSKLLETNISSLHKTARIEIARKDRMIANLRQEIDNLAFRRNNFRIPKNSSRPSVQPLPPKETNTFTCTVKQQVSETTNEEVDIPQSSLNELTDDEQDTVPIHEPKKIPVTVFGERLKKRLQQEVLEETQAKIEDISKGNQEITERRFLEGVSNDQVELDNVSGNEKNTITDERENEYRLIPLTLLNHTGKSRKRGSEVLESQEVGNERKLLDEMHEVKRYKTTNDCRGKESTQVNGTNEMINEKADSTTRRNNDHISTQSAHKTEFDYRNHQQGRRRMRNSRSRSRSRSRYENHRGTKHGNRRSRNRDYKNRDGNSALAVSPCLDGRRADSKKRSKSPDRHRDNDKLKNYPLSRGGERSRHISEKISDSIRKNRTSNRRNDDFASSNRRSDVRSSLRTRRDSKETKMTNRNYVREGEKRNYYKQEQIEVEQSGKYSKEDSTRRKNSKKYPESSDRKSSESTEREMNLIRNDEKPRGTKNDTKEGLLDKNSEIMKPSDVSAMSQEAENCEFRDKINKNREKIDIECPEFQESEKLKFLDRRKDSMDIETVPEDLDNLEEGEIPDSPIQPRSTLDNKVSSDIPQILDCNSDKHVNSKFHETDSPSLVVKENTKNTQILSPVKQNKGDKNGDVMDGTAINVLSSNKISNIMMVNDNDLNLSRPESDVTMSEDKKVEYSSTIDPVPMGDDKTMANIEVLIDPSSHCERNIAPFDTNEIKPKELPSITVPKQDVIEEGLMNNTNLESEVETAQTTIDKDISDESVHLTNILGDSSDDNVGITQISTGHQREPDEPTIPDSSHIANTSIDEHSPKQEYDSVTHVCKERKSFDLTEVQKGQVNCIDQPKTDLLCIHSPKSYEYPCPEASDKSSKITGPVSRSILQEIDSKSDKSSKTNEIRSSSQPTEKENSGKGSCTGAPTNKVVVVARRRKVKLTDSSTSMTVVVSAKQ